MDASFLLFAAILGSGQGASEVALPANDKWIFSEKLDFCEASRTFGSSEEVTLRLIARPNSPTYFLSAAFRQIINVSYGQDITVILAPNHGELHGRAVGFSPLDGKPTNIGVEVDATVFDDEDISTVSLSTKKAKLAYLAIDHVPAVVSRLRTCVKGLLTKFGIDPAVQAAVVVPPKPLSEFRAGVSNIYPAEALRSGAQGTVAGRFHIDSNGSVSDCAIVMSSGNASLDTTSCALVLRATKFRPALDKDGRPVACDKIFVRKWIIPVR